MLSNKTSTKWKWHCLHFGGASCRSRTEVGNIFWSKAIEKAARVKWNLMNFKLGPQTKQKLMATRPANKRSQSFEFTDIVLLMAFGPTILVFPHSSWAHQKSPLGPHVGSGLLVADPCSGGGMWRLLMDQKLPNAKPGRGLHQNWKR